MLTVFGTPRVNGGGFSLEPCLQVEMFLAKLSGALSRENNRVLTVPFSRGVHEKGIVLTLSLACPVLTSTFGAAIAKMI